MRRPTLFAALLVLAIGVLIGFLFLRRSAYSVDEAGAGGTGIPSDLFPPAEPSLAPSPKPAVAPPQTLDETLERLERIRPDDRAGYEALETAAAALVAKDPGAFVAYFRRSLDRIDGRAPRPSFFLAKLLLDARDLPGDAPVGSLVTELLARKPKPTQDPHDGPSALSLVKTFTLHELSESLPPTDDRRRLVPSLEKAVRSEPDLAVAREAAILLTRIQDDRGATVKRLLRGRSKEDREAFEDLP